MIHIIRERPRMTYHMQRIEEVLEIEVGKEIYCACVSKLNFMEAAVGIRVDMEQDFQDGAIVPSDFNLITGNVLLLQIDNARKEQVSRF
ncbi:hypothetical protein V6N13_078961 [Hibiscus sabdariffa]